MFDFEKQLAIGELGETLIKDYYHSKKDNKKNLYICRPASLEEQMKGADLFVVDGNLNCRYIEVKTDTQALDTENVAFEIQIVHKDKKTIGAAMKTFPDFLFYWIYPTTRILYWNPTEINPYLIDWMTEYRIVEAENKNFFSRTLIVPQSVVLATGVVHTLNLDWSSVDKVLQGVDGVSAILV